jgi:hypothetical protein
MRGYSIMSDEERNSIISQHKSFYDGFATGNVPSNETPLTVYDSANDKSGINVTSTGDVKAYTNNISEQMVIDAPDMDVSDVDPAYDFISQGPEGGETVEELEEKEMCEQCGSEMMEGECLEQCEMYEEIDEDLHESFKEQREKILENFNRFKKFN